MNTSCAIELSSVDKRYDKTLVVDGIDLQVETGESFVLIGHNGAGKTSLIKLMLGLSKPSAGQIRVLGEDPGSRTFSARRHLLGYLPESVSFYHHMTGLELLSYYARLKGVPGSEVKKCLQQVGLHEAGNKHMHTYSKGMRQRLGLAQAILGTPQLLFLDEPTTGLDPSLRRDFYQIIAELRNSGTTVVISSHSLNEIEEQADRIALIKSGKLVACGSLEELSKQTGLPVRTRLIVVAGQASHVAGLLEPHYQIEKIDACTLDLICSAEHKIGALGQLAKLGESVLDISMNAPRLDEIYLHFMQGEKP